METQGMTTFKTVDLTIRFMVLALSIILGFMFMIAGARDAFATSLKPSSVISGELLTLGDIFDGLSAEKASYALGPAPRPGQETILNARTLMRVASAMDLPWRPTSSADQIILRRDATVINNMAIENAVISSLRDKGIEGRFNLHFTNGALPEMVLPANSMESVEVTNLSINHQKGYFSAVLAAPSAHNPLAQASVSGKIERLVSLPILKSTLRHGDIISAADISWIDIDEKNIQHDLILTEQELIGLTPRRLAHAGKPLRMTELQHPQLVSRGDIITITYKDGPLSLIAKGKALQHGAKDDLIRVVNIGSNRSIEGFVSGDHMVTIMP